MTQPAAAPSRIDADRRAADIENGRKVLRTEGAALTAYADDLGDRFADAVAAMHACKGRVVVCGTVAMFVDRTDEGAAAAAIEAGVSAYVVDGLRQERIKPVLDAAIARFHMVSRMRAELTATKAALAERKTIDRAKGLLMKAKGLSEEEAYARLRKTAMDQGRKVVEVADSLVTAAELLK